MAKIISNTFICPNINNYQPTDYLQEDTEIYRSYKLMQDTDRWKQAQIDADWSFEYLIKIFGEVLNIQITKTNTPVLYNLLNEVYVKQEECHYQYAKVFFKKRPYVYLNESSGLKKHEEHLKNISSYPSGQAQLGWIFAKILATIDYKSEKELLKRGWEYGESRVIIGYHWMSDVINSRQIADAFLTELYKQENFKIALIEARKELLKLNKKV